MSARQDSSQESTRSDVYIVGRRKLQNETIASCLERETGNDCFVLEDISQIPPADPKDIGRQRLVLFDCQGKNPENVLAELRPHLKQKQSTNHVVLFSVGRNLGIEKKCVLEGVRGFFYETDPLDRFLKGLRAVLKGELWLSREIMTKCILEGTDRPSSSRSDSEPLTPRQIQILAQVSIGATNDEIAETLYLSPHTVRTHLHNIFKKINVPNRTQAALWAAKNL
jgi:LuxR family transcriptional regulator of csgAB operon